MGLHNVAANNYQWQLLHEAIQKACEKLNDVVGVRQVSGAAEKNVLILGASE